MPIAYVDRNQRYRFVNKAFLDWLGKREVDVLGREVIEVLGRDVYQLYRAYIDAALVRRAHDVRAPARSPPGRPPLWIRVDYYPDRSSQGHVRGFLVTYSDVDHLKRLELEAGQREHRLRLVTDSVGLPILYFDRQLKLRFANKPFGSLDRRAGRRRARPRARRTCCRPTRSPKCRATSSARSRARPSRTSGASASSTATRAGCASRCSRTARSAAASAARSS